MKTKEKANEYAYNYYTKNRKKHNLKCKNYRDNLPDAYIKALLKQSNVEITEENIINKRNYIIGFRKARKKKA